jgi:Ca-activated chloride channel family protein
MVNHRVRITMEDQVAITKVEQTFRNHTDRQLEATYVFPVPKGASVNKFTMWVNGTEVRGEMIEAEKARQIYTQIVQRTQDPGLLEYMGTTCCVCACFPSHPRAIRRWP